MHLKSLSNTVTATRNDLDFLMFDVMLSLLFLGICKCAILPIGWSLGLHVGQATHCSCNVSVDITR